MLKVELHKFTEEKPNKRVEAAAKKNKSKKIATEAKRSENQTFPGNWIVCTFSPFFRNILTLKNLKQSIRSKMLFLLFNYGFLLGWFFFFIFFFEAFVPANFNYAKQPTTYTKKRRTSLPKIKKRLKKTRTFFRQPNLCAGATAIYRLKYHFYSNYESFSSIFSPAFYVNQCLSIWRKKKWFENVYWIVVLFGMVERKKNNHN